MRRITSTLFGVVFPGLEVSLVAIGLILLGWEGTMYTLHGVWPHLTLGSLAALIGTDVAHAAGLTAWIYTLSLPGTCICTGIGMFFILPPAYAHA